MYLGQIRKSFGEGGREGGDQNAANVQRQYGFEVERPSCKSLTKCRSCSVDLSGYFEPLPLDGRGGSDSKPEPFRVAGKKGERARARLSAVLNVLTESGK